MTHFFFFFPPPTPTLQVGGGVWRTCKEKTKTVAQSTAMQKDGAVATWGPPGLGDLGWESIFASGMRGQVGRAVHCTVRNLWSFA